MKTALTLILAAVLSLPLAAQVRQERSVASFSRISVGSAIQLTLRQGSPQKVEVEASEKDMPEVIAEIRDGGLYLSMKEGYWERGGRRNQTDAVKAYVTVPNLEALRAGGAVIITGETEFTASSFSLDLGGASRATLTLKTDKLTANCSGASRTELKLTTDQLDVDLSGASTFVLTGTANRQQLDLSGASNYNAENLSSKTATLDISGASNAQVAVTKELSAEVSGGARLKYKGNPAVTHLESSGGGSIRKITE